MRLGDPQFTFKAALLRYINASLGPCWDIFVS
jgi:hypothetical protein